MPAELSRRALFRRLAAGGESQPQPAGPKVARVGETCISLAGVACRLCQDPCEPDAIRFQLMTRGRAAPVVDAGRCTGCGHCMPSCPVGALDLVPAPAPIQIEEV